MRPALDLRQCRDSLHEWHCWTGLPRSHWSKALGNYWAHRWGVDMQSQAFRKLRNIDLICVDYPLERLWEQAGPEEQPKDLLQHQHDARRFGSWPNWRLRAPWHVDLWTWPASQPEWVRRYPWSSACQVPLLLNLRQWVQRIFASNRLLICWQQHKLQLVPGHGFQ